MSPAASATTAAPAATTTTSTSTVMTLLTGQSGSFKLTSTSAVAYGSGVLMTTKSLASGTYTCGDQLFGDPAPGKPKACYSTSAATATVTTPVAKPAAAVTTTAQLSMLTGQTGTFTLTSAANIVYGTGTKLVEKLLAAGTYNCGDQLFGDPAPGVNKQCYFSTTVAAAPAVTTPIVTAPAAPAAPAPTVNTNANVLAVAGDVMVNGAVSNAEYQAMAQKMGTDAAIAYRYGPSSADY
ncbi:hypothetical protein ACSFA3_20790, partial [Variovorax sp. RHLX14]